MKFESGHKPISAFNFSSLTDIVMLLLIFFLLTSQFVLQTGVKVKLPGAKNNDPTETANYSVTITESGKMYVGNEEATYITLAGKLSKLKSEGKLENLIIRADKAVKIDMVIKVIDDAKGIGIDKFTIQTDKISF